MRGSAIAKIGTMSLNFKFAIVSDPHITLPHTLWDSPHRFHLGEVSIPALEKILAHLSNLDLDFLLLPGDLTQHGEPDNHRWLAQRLSQLPYPAYVIPGNHDIPVETANGTSIGMADFPTYYPASGYDNPRQLYYTHPLLPGVRLIGLNSNQFDAQGDQIGWVDDAQLRWLEQVLQEFRHERLLVMIHHNVLEHLPGQANSAIGRRYMLGNAPALLNLLRAAGVQLIFTGHLHIQDIAYSQGIYDITTGSLVSYPHPYRVLHFQTDRQGNQWLQIESSRVEAVPGWEQLQTTSREHLGARSQPFMLQLLTQPPLNLPLTAATPLVPDLRYFWAEIAKGDPLFQFPHFPDPVRRYFESFSAISRDGTPTLIDNATSLLLTPTPISEKIRTTPQQVIGRLNDKI